MIGMAKLDDWNIGSILVPIGGFVALLYSYFYIQQLSFILGEYYGVSNAVKAYSINVSQQTAMNLGQTSTLALALHISYILVPFAILIFAIGVLWLFSRLYSKFLAAILIFASIIYIIIAALLQIDFKFSSALGILPGAYIGGLLAIAGGAYVLVKSGIRATGSKRAVRQISINPDTPYSNMRILSNKLMKRLSGDIKVLDMHFDIAAMDNLIQLVDKNLDRYRSISVLAKSDRLNGEFEKSYTDFKNELRNKNVEFELRILNEKEASKQHERMLIDDYSAYKIPPLNIINKKSEHIVSINSKDALHRFNSLWSEAIRFENFRADAPNPQK
jgi:hypothetical protein